MEGVSKEDVFMHVGPAGSNAHTLHLPVMDKK